MDREDYKYILNYFYETAVEMETVFRILIANGLCTHDDIETIRKEVEKNGKFKETYDQIQSL